MEEKEMNKDVKDLSKEANYLFNLNFYKDLTSDEIEDTYLDYVDTLLNNYNWFDIFNSWFDYLKTSCPNDDDVINWANLFLWYDGCEHPIPDPYEFLGYLFYRVDVSKNADAQHIFDSISISVLEKIGKVDIVSDTTYTPESDPEILKAVAKWKNNEYK